MATGQLYSRSLKNALHNPALLLVLVLEFVLLGILGILLFILLLLVIAKLNPAVAEATSPEQFISVIFNAKTIILVTIVVLIEGLIAALIDSFFKAGFFGMVRNTIQDGSTTIREFMPSARMFFTRIFGVQLVRYAIIIVGFLPALATGLMVFGTSPQFVEPQQWLFFGVSALIGLLIWLAAFILLIYAEPAVVFHGQRSMQALRSSLRLVTANKGRTALLALLALISIIIASIIESVLHAPLISLAENNPATWQMASDLWGLLLNLFSLYAAVVVAMLIFLFYRELTGTARAQPRGRSRVRRPARKATRVRARAG